MTCAANKESNNVKFVEKTLSNTCIHYWINDGHYDKCIVFLHPAFGNHTCFDSQAEYFGKRHKVITIDLIGHGASIGKGTMLDASKCIHEILIQERIDRANIVGVSIGEVIAGDFANKYGEQVSSLICIGGYDINHFDKDLLKGNGNRQVQMMLTAMLSIKKFAESNKLISCYTPEGQEKFYHMNLQFKKSSFRYLATLGAMINKMETPKRNYTLFIGVGEHDADMAKKASELWHEHEPESKLVVFKDAGHIVNLDIPDEFNKTLDEFIR